MHSQYGINGKRKRIQPYGPDFEGVSSIHEVKEKKENKRSKPDFFKNQIKEGEVAKRDQSEQERRSLASFSSKTVLDDITNKASNDTSPKKVDGQGKINDVKDLSSEQSEQKKEQKEQQRRQEHERERIRQNLANKKLNNDVTRNLQDDLKDIGQSIQLKELNKFSMTDRSMESRGVDPEKFRRVSQELSNALENRNPDQVRISATRKEFVEMAKKLGLIPREI